MKKTALDIAIEDLEAILEDLTQVEETLDDAKDLSQV